MPSWTTPRTYTDDEVITKAILDVHVRDNLGYLKGVLDGTESQAVLLRSTLTLQPSTAINTGLEIGSLAGATTPLIDFHSSGNNIAYDVRIIANGGSGSVGQGQLTIAAAAILLSGNGSVSAPMVAWSDDTNTGIYRAGADDLRLAAGGARRLSITGTEVQVGETPGNETSTSPITLYGQTKLSSTIATGGVPLTVNANGDGTLISLRESNTEEGTITVSGTTVAYNTFLGAHYTQLLADQDEPPIGGVVVVTGEIVPGGRPARERFPRVAGTIIPADSRVYGVWFGRLRDEAGETLGDPEAPLYQVAGVGLWQCRVTDCAGDIQPGDLLETSSRRYEAQRQTNTVLRSSTLGKAMVGVDWSMIEVDPVRGYKWTMIPVVLYAG